MARFEVFTVETVTGDDARADAPADLLFEVPHGATERRHFDAVRRRLRGRLPDGLEAFFFVNTDVGAPEYARQSARLIARPESSPRLLELLGPALTEEVRRLPPRKIVILRCLVPRTFVDCNRVVDSGTREVTAAIPGYVEDAADVRALQNLHRRYDDRARQGYAEVCVAGGLALQLHTYAPRAISLERIDGGIIEALRRAYEPEVYATWPERPDVDVISEASDGRRLAPPSLVAGLRELYARLGVRATENETYRLHPATLGYRYSTAYPGQVLCMEINRARLADPFKPFEPMRIGASKVAEMSLPVAAACLAELAGMPGASRQV